MPRMLPPLSDPAAPAAAITPAAAPAAAVLQPDVPQPTVPQPDRPPPGLPQSDASMPPLAEPPMGDVVSPKLHDVTIVRRSRQACARVEGVPPEEFGIARNARGLRDCGYC